MCWLALEPKVLNMNPDVIALSQTIVTFVIALR